MSCVQRLCHWSSPNYFSLSSAFLYSLPPICVPLYFVFTSHIYPPSRSPSAFCEQWWHHESRKDALRPAHPGWKDLPTSPAGCPHRTQQRSQLGPVMAFWPPGNAALYVILSAPQLNITNNNGNPWSGKSWGFHHEVAHLKIKIDQELTVLQAKNIMLALAPQKGIRKVSPGLESFLADLQDSCVFSTWDLPQTQAG